MTHRLMNILSSFILLITVAMAADINDKAGPNLEHNLKGMIFELGNKATVSLLDPKLDERLRQIQPACPNSPVIPPATDGKKAFEGRYNIGAASIGVAKKVIERIEGLNNKLNALRRNGANDADIYLCLKGIREWSPSDLSRFLILVSATLQMGKTDDTQQKFFLHDPRNELEVNLQDNNNYIKIDKDLYTLPNKLPKDVYFSRHDETGYVLDKFRMLIVRENLNVAYQPFKLLDDYNDPYGFFGFDGPTGQKVYLKGDKIDFGYRRLKEIVNKMVEIEKSNPHFIIEELELPLPKEVEELGEITQDHVEDLYRAKYNNVTTQASFLLKGKRGDEHQAILQNENNIFKIYKIFDFTNMKDLSNPKNAEFEERNLNALEARLAVHWTLNLEVFDFKLSEEEPEKGVATPPQVMFAKIYGMQGPKKQQKD